jgi:cyclomaltodextrinase
MNYLVTIACLGFFGGDRLDLKETRRTGSYRGVRPLDAEEFAERIDWLLHLYEPAITQVQLNLLDSHDTTRFLTSVSGDQSALRLAILFLFTYPGAPCLYYGDEIGLDGKHDPGCRKAFPWDPAQWDHGLLDFVKKCIALRGAHPALRRGTYEQLYAQEGVYAFQRQLGDDVLVIALNTAWDTREIDIPIKMKDGDAGSLGDVWNGTPWRVREGSLQGLTLASRSGVVLTGNIG